MEAGEKIKVVMDDTGKMHFLVICKDFSQCKMFSHGSAVEAMTYLLQSPKARDEYSKKSSSLI